MYHLKIALALLITLAQCSQAQTANAGASDIAQNQIMTGAQQTDQYLTLLENKRVALVGNQTTVIGNTHLADTLLASGVRLVKVFAPEHGFRGEAGAGETIKNGKDNKTGLPVISLYGKNKKPTAEMLQDVDLLIFDIQDVGARFYTYISTMHYVMEAASELNKEVIVLDRPNPNGFYVDGPILKPAYKSFVGMHPIPVVHGCTVGELAKMINGEGWLSTGKPCKLEVISCKNYSHSDLYELPIAPSPNLPNMAAVYLYPSLCWFEGTTVSVGRGTNLPFQCIGYPGNTTGKFSFTPVDIPGVVTNPPHEGKLCKGHNLQEFGEFFITTSKAIYLDWIVGMYTECTDKATFFTAKDFFDKLAGSDALRKQLEAGNTAEQIRASWSNDLNVYKTLRKKYLLYPDFE